MPPQFVEEHRVIELVAKLLRQHPYGPHVRHQADTVQSAQWQRGPLIIAFEAAARLDAKDRTAEDGQRERPFRRDNVCGVALEIQSEEWGARDG